MVTKRNNTVDILRLAAALFVICLHSFSGSGVWGSEETVALSRFAVPMFFLFSGYFAERFDRCRKLCQFVRILLLAVFASLCYLLVELSRQQTMPMVMKRLREIFSPLAWRDLLLFNMSSISDHLWFLAALAYCILIDLLLSNIFQRVRHGRAIRWGIAACLLFGGLVVYHVLTSCMGSSFPLYMYRNFLFVGLPFYMTGKLLRGSAFMKKALPTPLYPILFLAFTGITLAEYYLLGVWELYLGSIMTACLLVHLAHNHPLENTGRFVAAIAWLGKNTALTIYIVHVFILDIVREIYRANLPWQYEPGLYHLIPIAVFCISLLAGVLVSLFKTVPAMRSAKRKVS